MGVILWHRIELGPPGAAGIISNDVLEGGFALDAEVTVTYEIGQPGIVKVELHDLPIDLTDAIADALERADDGPMGGVPISVELGYLDGGPQAPVLHGRIDRLRAEVRKQPLVTKVAGFEEAAFKLLSTRKLSEGDPPARVSLAGPVSPQQVVTTLTDGAGVATSGPVTPAEPQLTGVELVGRDAFRLLEQFAERMGAEVLVQDDKVQFGTAVTGSPAGPAPAPPDPGAVQALAGLLTAEDSLVVLDPFITTRLADFQPVALGRRTGLPVSSDLPDRASVAAFDFTVLGHPGLRAGQLVAATVRDYADPFNAFRVLRVTHSYSPRTGYVCTGRAVVFDPAAPAGTNRRISQQARDASAGSVVEELTRRAARDRDEHPSVDVGRVRSSKPAERTATLHYGQQAAPDKPVASVDVDVPEGNPLLFDKPLAAPFAWDGVGLCVPVYPGMRALLAQSHDVREDAVVAGFLWANTPSMRRPPAADKDWWLCLPTELDGDGLPTGRGANDLIAGDGRRVVEAAGLRLLVGKDKLTELGTRPTEGATDELVVEHASGTTVTVAADGAVKVAAASGKAISLTAGGVTLTVGDGKVKVGK